MTSHTLKVGDVRDTPAGKMRIVEFFGKDDSGKCRQVSKGEPRTGADLAYRSKPTGLCYVPA